MLKFKILFHFNIAVTRVYFLFIGIKRNNVLHIYIYIYLSNAIKDIFCFFVCQRITPDSHV